MCQQVTAIKVKRYQSVFDLRHRRHLIRLAATLAMLKQMGYKFDYVTIPAVPRPCARQLKQ